MNNLNLAEELNIVPGYFCNKSCSNCISNSGPDRKGSKLTEREILSIKKNLLEHSPLSIAFTGGEPTLYIEIINELLEHHPNLDNTKISITTNGWFAKSEDLVEKTLSKIVRLNEVRVSVDTFHGLDLTHEKLCYLEAFCNSKDIKLKVVASVTSPIELVAVTEVVKELSIEIILQNSIPAGRGKDNGTAFSHSTFHESVLDQKCPGLGNIAYICGKGFSPCCSSLTFNHNLPETYASEITDLKAGVFFTDLNKKTFRQLAEDRKISFENLKPEHSSPCRLCEYIFTEVK